MDTPYNTDEHYETSEAKMHISRVTGEGGMAQVVSITASTMIPLGDFPAGRSIMSEEDVAHEKEHGVTRVSYATIVTGSIFDGEGNVIKSTWFGNDGTIVLVMPDPETRFDMALGLLASLMDKESLNVVGAIIKQLIMIFNETDGLTATQRFMSDAKMLSDHSPIKFTDSTGQEKGEYTPSSEILSRVFQDGEES